jgi:hypothetical protein
MAFRHALSTSCATAALACAGPAGLAVAQENSFRFELAPYAAYRVGGQFEEEDGGAEFELEESNAQGIILNIRARSNTQWELLYSRQNTQIDTQSLFGNGPSLDLDVEYFHFGGTYLFDGDDIRPFLALTVGLSRFDPQPQEFGVESYLSASIGGGLQFMATRRLGVRVEARAFTTFVESDSDVLCASTGQINLCAIRVDGTTLTQLEARAGLVFRF